MTKVQPNFLYPKCFKEVSSRQQIYNGFPFPFFSKTT